MEPPVKASNPNPHNYANRLSRLLLCWTSVLFRLGYRKDLTDADIYDVLPEHSSIRLSNGLLREWEKELYRWRSGGTASLFKALCRCYGPGVLLIGLLLLVEEGLRLTQAFILGEIVSYFEPSSTVPKLHAYLYAAAFSISYILVTLIIHPAFHFIYLKGLQIRVACTSLMYRKAMKLRNTTENSKEMSGHIIDLMSSDVYKFDQSVFAANFLWLGPLLCIASGVLLYYTIGLSCLVGIGLLLIYIPVQVTFGKLVAKYRNKATGITDKRLRVMNEIVHGMRVIKMFCWEKPFGHVISKYRQRETDIIKRAVFFKGFSLSFYFIYGKLVTFGTFLVYVLLGNPLTAKAVFVSLLVFEVLRLSIGMMVPLGIQYGSEAMEAIDKIQKFLMAEERSQNGYDSASSLNGDTVIQYQDYTANWKRHNTSFAVCNISLTVEKGQLIGIVGPSESGKSSLLMTMLNEIPRVSGFLRVKGHVSYAAAQPWVFSGSLRDNILFGAKLDRQRYNRILNACCLVKDLESLPYSDLTEIGDKGISMSDSQKSRVHLARAVYHDADIYLLDCPLVDVDNKTATEIFMRCICTVLKNKTVFIVTDRLNFMKSADQILVMKDGTIDSTGTYEDLSNLLMDYEKAHSSSVTPVRPPSTSKVPAVPSVVTRAKKRLDYSNHTSMESLQDITLEIKDPENDHDEKQLVSEGKTPSYVRMDTFLHYFLIGSGLSGLVAFFVLWLLTLASYVLSDWWLAFWASLYRNQTQSNVNSNLLGPDGIYYNLAIYVGLTVAALIFTIMSSIVFLISALRTSKILHDDMFEAVIRAPILFFERSPLGRILRRFSQDVSFVDDLLPSTFFDTIQSFSLVLVCVMTVCAMNYWLFIILLVLAFIFGYARYYYIQTARDIRRMEATSRTPIYTHLTATLEGLWTVRALKNEERFLHTFDTYQDRHTAVCYMGIATARWIALRLDILLMLFVTLVAFGVVVTKEFTDMDPGHVGLSLVYAVSLLWVFQYSVRQTLEIESELSSVAKILKYSSMEPEAAAVLPSRPPLQWPKYGIITLESVSIMYKKGGPKVLKNVTCCLRAQEKIGLIGRPGAGKSTLVAAILRLIEPNGTVRIDGLDTKEIGLQDLREKISIIPQDPVLLSGTVRKNLDPSSLYTDAQLWKAIEEVHLKKKIESLPGKLYADLSDIGHVFTLGQKQLLCLARALIRHNSILIYEETTGHIHQRVDALIQKSLRQKFKCSTVAIVAHRLTSVIDMDRVMVMDAGRIKEIDPPHLLLQNPNGLFTKMVEKIGGADAEMLREIAKKKYEDEPYVAPVMEPYNERPVYYTPTKSAASFLPSFQSSRLTGVLSNLSSNRYALRKF